MYKLKEGITWKDIKDTYNDGAAVNFEDEFEKIELPVADWTNGSIKTKLYEIEVFSTYTKVTKYNEVNTKTMIVCISKKDDIKSVAEFNEKCALMFGFYLKEV